MMMTLNDLIFSVFKELLSVGVVFSRVTKGCVLLSHILSIKVPETLQLSWFIYYVQLSVLVFCTVH